MRIVIIPAYQLDHFRFSSAMQSPIMPCYIQARADLRLSLRGNRARCTAQVYKTANAPVEPTGDKKLYSRIERPLRVDTERLRHSVLHGVKAVRRAEDTMARLPLSLI